MNTVLDTINIMSPRELINVLRNTGREIPQDRCVGELRDRVRGLYERCDITGPEIVCEYNDGTWPVGQVLPFQRRSA